eukprot:203478_1
MSLLFLVLFLTLHLSQSTTLLNEPNGDAFTVPRVSRLASALHRFKANKGEDEYNTLNYFNANAEEEEQMMTGPSAMSLQKLSFFKAKDGKILVKWPNADDYDFFKWNVYKQNFDAGHLSDEEKKAMVDLRQKTVYKLLTYIYNKLDPPQLGHQPYELTGQTAENDDVYRKLGSDTPSSDFDFSFVRWDKPETVVKSLIKYQNKLFQTCILAHALVTGFDE